MQPCNKEMRHFKALNFKVSVSMQFCVIIIFIIIFFIITVIKQRVLRLTNENKRVSRIFQLCSSRASSSVGLLRVFISFGRTSQLIFI